MKIAIPVKLNRENPPVAPLFGKAKWFAIVDNDRVEIVPNRYEGGLAVINWFLEIGVDVVIVQEIGFSPYEKIKNSSIALYHAGENRILLSEVLEKFDNGKLEIVDDTNIHKLVKHKRGGNGRGRERNFSYC